MTGNLSPTELRVLVVHNMYRSEMPSGENVVVCREVDGLRAAGVEVSTFFRSSDELDDMSFGDRCRAAVSPLTGLSSREPFMDVLDDYRPNLVHIHNTYPLISPQVIDWCETRSVPVVATIHNFRLKCLNGLFFRDQAICVRCESLSVPWPGAALGCYRGSRPQSLVMTAALVTNRDSWTGVSTFIAVSDFVASRLESWLPPGSRIAVKQNPVEDPGQTSEPGRGFLFAGRLSEEKGVSLLLDAWRESGLGDQERLVVAGSGPLEDLVKARSKDVPGIEFVGQVNQSQLGDFRQETAVAVIPSLCYESHGAMGESFAYGRPVVATRTGALAHSVDDSVGWLADTNVVDLARCLESATDRPAICRRAIEARNRFVDSYESVAVTSKLVDVYMVALSS